MKNYMLILSAAMMMISACSVNTAKNTSHKPDSATQQNVDKSVEKGLVAEMQIRDTIKVGDSVLLKFTVFNHADSAQHFCKWHTPFEPLMSKYLEVKDENGNEVDYRGAMAKRIMPPPASSYIKVDQKGSILSMVDVLKGFAIDKPGKYTITYVGQNMSGLVVNKSVAFVYIK
jgi:hypothetical protein